MTVTSAPTSLRASTAARPAAGRLIGLDALRVVAAALVFAHHLAPSVLGPGTGQGLDVGVMIFFALSGFVLYRPFLLGQAAIGSFVVRRIARLWPAYLVASVGVAWLFEPRFLANPVGLVTMASTPLGVVWTLKLELLFSALLPLIARAAIRGPSGGRLVVLIGFAVAGLRSEACPARQAAAFPLASPCGHSCRGWSSRN